MPLKSEAYNEAVRTWGASGKNNLIATGRGMGIQHRENSSSQGESLAKIKDKYGFDKIGFISRVTFSTVNRSLIYTSAGAGKGRGGNKGSRWIDRYGNTKRTNPKSLGKAGTAGRQAKPFIIKMLDGTNGVEQLADIVANHQADAIVDTILVK